MGTAGLSVLIVGGGFAGTAVARMLGARAEVTLIADENYLLFTPMLAEVAAADVDPRHILSPLRQLCPAARLVVGEVLSIDPGRRSVEVALPLTEHVRTYQADVVVIAVGSVPQTFGIAGVDEHALPFKSIVDALRIRNRMLTLLDVAGETGRARDTHLAVVGAGFSGAELAAAMADFLADVARRYYPAAPTPRVTLVDAVDRVTPTLDPRLSRAAEGALRERGVDVVLGRKVTEVSGTGVTLDDGATVDASTVVWSAGVRPHPLAAATGLAEGGGRIPVDDRLRAAPSVFALGDAAAVPDGYGGTCPPTAQHAVRQGRYLGRHLVDLAAGASGRPFRYKTKGQLVALGHRNAVGMVMGFGVTGFPAWWLWRTYYLLQLPTLHRKTRVALDWALDLVFPPDITAPPSSDLGPR